MKKILFSKPVQAVIILIYIGVLGYVFIPHFIHHSRVGTIPSNKIIKCDHLGRIYFISINDKEFTPKKNLVKTCDEIVFKNTGSKYHEPAFGDHPFHLIYPGFNEKAMKVGETNLVVMTVFGEFKIHDHIYEEIEGQITVEH